MSRFTPPTPSSPTAVLHHAAGHWHALIASSSGDGWTVIAAETTDDPRELSRLIEKHEVVRTIGVLPASSVVCRTCALPDAPGEALYEALGLQAEALAGAGVDHHRQAAAVLPAAPGETSRCGLIVSWPGACKAPALPIEGITYAAEVVGLAGLLGAERPNDPLLWLDRESGNVALAVTHANGAAFRGTREDASAGSDWVKRVQRTVAETALSAGHSGAYAESIVRKLNGQVSGIGADDAALVLPSDIRRAGAARIEGAPDDDRWWSTYGIPAGVLLASASELAPLTRLREVEIKEKPSRTASLVDTFSKPQTARKLAVAAMLILALAPLLLSGLRLAILNWRYPDISDHVRTVKKLKSEVAMYQALQGQATSMTKIYADLVSNVPEGVELELVSVSDGKFRIRGEARPHKGASALDAIGTVLRQLQDSRVFSQVNQNIGERNAYDQYAFGMSGDVSRPHLRPRFDTELDWAKWPLVDRQGGRPPKGEGDEGEAPADTTTAVATAEPVDDDSVPPRQVAPPEDPSDDPEANPDEPGDEGTSTRRPPRGIGGGPVKGTDRPSDGSGAIDPRLIPPALTKEEIEAMTIDEVNSHLEEVAKARGKVKGPDNKELSDRLKQEFRWLLARKIEASKEMGE